MVLGTVVIASLLGAIIALDDNVVLRVMLAQPIACGVLVGLVMGDVRSGLIVGLIFELLWVFDIPAGGFISQNPAIGTAVTTILYVLVSQPGARPAPQGGLALPILAIVGIGAAVLSVAATKRLRHFNERFYARAVRGVASGRLSSVWRNHLAALVPMLLKNFAIILVAVLGTKFAILPLLGRLWPGSAQAPPRVAVAVFVSAGVGIGLEASRSAGWIWMSVLSMVVAAAIVLAIGPGRPILRLAAVLSGCGIVTLIWERTRVGKRQASG